MNVRVFNAVLVTAALAAAMPGSAARAADPAPEPVMVGGSAVLVACMSVGHVKARNFVNLKAAPSARAVNLGKLQPGEHLTLCEDAVRGTWVGVVVTSKNGTDCGVATPIRDRVPYSGKCRSGWLEARYVEIAAG